MRQVARGNRIWTFASLSLRVPSAACAARYPLEKTEGSVLRAANCHGVPWFTPAMQPAAAVESILPRCLDACKGRPTPEKRNLLRVCIFDTATWL